jgi:hypothetical protein
MVDGLVVLGISVPADLQLPSKFGTTLTLSKIHTQILDFIHEPSNAAVTAPVDKGLVTRRDHRLAWKDHGDAIRYHLPS